MICHIVLLSVSQHVMNTKINKISLCSLHRNYGWRQNQRKASRTTTMPEHERQHGLGHKRAPLVKSSHSQIWRLWQPRVRVIYNFNWSFFLKTLILLGNWDKMQPMLHKIYIGSFQEEAFQKVQRLFPSSNLTTFLRMQRLTTKIFLLMERV